MVALIAAFHRVLLNSCHAGFTLVSCQLERLAPLGQYPHRCYCRGISTLPMGAFAPGVDPDPLTDLLGYAAYDEGHGGIVAPIRPLTVLVVGLRRRRRSPHWSGFLVRGGRLRVLTLLRNSQRWLFPPALKQAVAASGASAARIKPGLRLLRISDPSSLNGRRGPAENS
jgi:hypothetical protein